MSNDPEKRPSFERHRQWLKEQLDNAGELGMEPPTCSEPLLIMPVMQPPHHHGDVAINNAIKKRCMLLRIDRTRYDRERVTLPIGPG